MKRSFWLVFTLTVVAFSILVKLGFWQLSRADEKQQIEQLLQQRAIKSLVDIDNLKQGETNYNGLLVSGHFTSIANKYLLLDNQTYLGKVGYLALQLMVTPQGKYVLLERGFVEAPLERTELPEVEWLSRDLNVEGRLYQRSSNPMSSDLFFESGDVARIQNINIDALSQQWQLSIEPYVVQPTMVPWPYPQPWSPVPMTSTKHIGYAVQWFGLSIALLILSGWILKKTLCARRPQ